FLDQADVPLGRVATHPGRLIVFPNTHLYRFDTMRNTGNSPGKQRTIVFFLVNPDVRIISTQEVPNQFQAISHEDALKYCEQLKGEREEERDWNVREIVLRKPF